MFKSVFSYNLQAGKYHEMRNLARSHSSHIRQIDLDVNSE